MSGQSTVSIVRIHDSIDRGVREAIELLGEFPFSITPGMNILIKPNVIRAETASVGTTTNIEIIRTTANFFLEKGAKVVIGEASGNQYNTEAIYSLLRFREELPDLEIRDLDRDKIIQREIEGALALKRVGISETVHNADLIVSLPVMKTHNCTLFTGGMKNMMGTLPQREKWNMHLSGIHQALVDLNRLVKPHLIVMDAIYAMEGWGPAMGYPVGMNLVLASTDVVAIDCVAAAIMEIDVSEVKHLTLAGEQEVGAADVSRIEVRGVPINDVKRPFRRPQGFKIFEVYGKTQYVLGNFFLNRFNYDIRPIIRAASLFHLPKPKLNRHVCTDCGECVTACPENAIALASPPKIDYSKCTRCMICYDACNDAAILISRLPMWMLKVRNSWASRPNKK